MVAEDAITALRDTIRVRHYSYRSEQTNLDWARRFFGYLRETGARVDGRPIVTKETIRDFIPHLATRRQVAASTQNQAFAALLLLSREVLGLDVGDLGRTVRAKRGDGLPTVLSVEEVRRLFAKMDKTLRLMVETIYGGGLRVSECCRLRIQNVDFDNDAIRVLGKGDKFRATLLPESLKAPLQKHLARVRALFDQDRAAGVAEVHLPDTLGRKYPNAAVEWAWFWVFPSRTFSIDPRTNTMRRHHVSDVPIQRAVREAAVKADIAKHVSVHTLRPSFAPHLLLQNVDLRQIQELLGHRSVETTMIYTHVVKDLRRAHAIPSMRCVSSTTSSPLEAFVIAMSRDDQVFFCGRSFWRQSPPTANRWRSRAAGMCRWTSSYSTQTGTILPGSSVPGTAAEERAVTTPRLVTVGFNDTHPAERRYACTWTRAVAGWSCSWNRRGDPGPTSDRWYSGLWRARCSATDAPAGERDPTNYFFPAGDLSRRSSTLALAVQVMPANRLLRTASLRSLGYCVFQSSFAPYMCAILPRIRSCDNYPDTGGRISSHNSTS